MVEPYVDGAAHDTAKWWTDPEVQAAIRAGSDTVRAGQYSGALLIRVGADLVMHFTDNRDLISRMVKREVYPNAVVLGVNDALKLRREEVADTTAAINSGTWTGTQSVQARARAIRPLIAPACMALDSLISEAEHRLHNHPPEPVEQEFFADLRLLHQELGALLDTIDGGTLAELATARVKAAADRAFELSKVTGGSALLGISSFLAAQPAAWAAWALVELICAPSVASVAAPSALIGLWTAQTNLHAKAAGKII